MQALFTPVSDDLIFYCFLKIGESHWHRSRGEFESAVRAALEGATSAKRYYPLNGYVSMAFPVLAHALRAYADQHSASPRAAVMANEAMVAARRAVRYSRKSNYALPYALRELALNNLSAGKLRKAHRQIRESLAVAQRQEAKYEHAQSLLVCGRIGEKLGLPEARQQIAEAEAALAEFEKQMEQATKNCLTTSFHSQGA
jgi:hypothetical protein